MTEFVLGVTDGLRDTPYKVVLTPFEQYNDPLESVREIVDSGGADGIILSQIQTVDPRVEYIANAGLPFVTYGRTSMGIDHAYYDFDCTAFARQAVKLLAHQGRKRICLLAAPERYAFAQYLLEGFIQEMHESGLEICPFSLVTQYDSKQDIVNAVASLCAQNNPPDGFVCGGINAAIGALGGVEKVGLVVGREVDIVTKQSPANLLQWFGRPLYSVEENFRAAGRGSAESLLKIIDGEPVSNHQIIASSSGEPRNVLESL